MSLGTFLNSLNVYDLVKEMVQIYGRSPGHFVFFFVQWEEKEMPPTLYKSVMLTYSDYGSEPPFYTIL